MAFNALSSENALSKQDRAAFTKHQAQLQKLFFGLRAYYRKTQPESFSTSLFCAERIQQTATEPLQPDATVFPEREMTEFANLPDLPSQQQWVKEKLQAVYNDLGRIQEAGKEHLGEVPFERYYRQKVRFDYLQELSRTLQVSTEKRTSLIARYHQSLPTLGEMRLTDAQRLGFARLHADLIPSPANLAEYTRLYDLYAPYAVAEVLNKPYEFALEHGANSIFLLSEEESEYLANLSNEQKLLELPAKIESLKNQLAQMRRQLSSTPDFYKRYYFLSAQLDIYSSLLKRAEFFTQPR